MSKEMSKRQQRREQIRRKDLRGRIVGIVLVTLGALFVAFLIIWPNVKPAASVKQIVPDPRPQADANNMGDPNAPIKIVEYSDYQCPFCERFYEQTESLLVETYIESGKVYFTYRSMGNWVSANINAGRTESEDAAKAAYCAGDQNLFWEMHDMLFVNVIGEDVGSFTDKRLSSIAETTGLDMDQYEECYSSNKYKDQADQDMKDGREAGVNGTPGFIMTYTNKQGEVITGLIEGAQPFTEFQTRIEAALADIGQ